MMFVHTPHIYDDEYEFIMEELIEYSENWQQSSEEGWFYPDDEWHSLIDKWVAQPCVNINLLSSEGAQ